ncbi:ABC transporter ATP-binding protein [uncultured Desulfovibrio sp.]|uniref:ABC transporter ATP-binding protein n=1 Tax=uncultured Desulfovibrio sp. TaxID=167968 RepID=UPI0025FE8EE3|nr:ABC transporter ATP-binding protein [uncultured Desulfovibrio sp.]
MKPIISVEDLGKKYVIRHQWRSNYRALRDEIMQFPLKLLRGMRQEKEEFWALQNVGFDIMPGERVGIIGRNGAGKSTLLKLLSRITIPTSGRICLRGRISSLLEVGTGFHPELTGRENIFLNGAILGMSRAEIRRKFDEIVDFAGVEKFLDTPVKRYSSGMYVRLAFAVAAHLEPEILIVDEVLAVGDVEFQKKCLGKMEQVGKDGRTVLFVSHNIESISLLCTRGIVLANGRILHDGDIQGALAAYREDILHASHELDHLLHEGNGDFRLTGVEVFGMKDGAPRPVETGQDMHLRLVYSPGKAGSGKEFGKMTLEVRISDMLSRSVIWVSTAAYPEKKTGVQTRFTFPKLPLIPGDYLLNVCAHRNSEIVDWIRDYSFTVHPGAYYGTGYIPFAHQSSVCHDFSFECEDDAC